MLVYQPLGQVAVDYCAIVIYGLCHRTYFLLGFFFEAGQAQTKTIQFAMDFILPPPLAPLCLFSTLWYTISNKSQRFVFLSPSFLGSLSDTRALGWSLRAIGRRGGRTSALELWLRDWVSFGSDKLVTFRPAVVEEGTWCCCYQVASMWTWLSLH